GVLISALGIGLMSLVAQPWHALLFYGVVFAIGSGLASLTPVGVIVTHAFPARTGFVNASVISGTSVGQLVMIAIFAALLALMGLTGLIGLIATGLLSDRVGPARTAALSFAARVAVFALIAVDQSILSIVIFALVFGATFLVTAPLVVLFVRDHFGMSHLG